MGLSLWDGHYEVAVCEIIKKLLEPGGVFIDVGANEGYYSVIGSKVVGPKGVVISIEPQNRLIPIIQKNLSLNNASNVLIFNVAVADGTLPSSEIRLSPSTTTGSSSLVKGYFLARKQKVMCKSLTELLDEQKIRTADVAKIDVEGYEPEVLKGAIPLLRDRRIRHLFVDYHQSILVERGLDAFELHSFLADLNYGLEMGNFSPSGYNLYAPKHQ